MREKRHPVFLGTKKEKPDADDGEAAFLHCLKKALLLALAEKGILNSEQYEKADEIRNRRR